jgi:hypothetical protein
MVGTKACLSSKDVQLGQKQKQKPLILMSIITLKADDVGWRLMRSSIGY